LQDASKNPAQSYNHECTLASARLVHPLIM
jgi:hypothetical protein